MIYIDSDGVLADFDRWVIEKDPYILNSYRSGKFDMKIYEILVKHVGEAYLSFKEIEENRYLLDMVRSREDVKVLTALPSPRHIAALGYSQEECDRFASIWTRNKLEWFERRGILEDKIVVSANSSEKCFFCKGPQDILLDDFDRNCKEWREAGGTAIKMHNCWYDSEFLGNFK